jgi:Iron-containing redox enzyme
MTATLSQSVSRSRKLRAKIELVLPELMTVAQAFWGHPQFAELYPRFLVAMHGLTRASVPLMQAAVEQLDGREDEDPLAAPVAAYLRHHIPEERGHDDWVLQDLRVLGFDTSRVLEQPPSAVIAELVGSQYYWIFHYHPVALLGYIAVIEGYPPSPDGVARMQAVTGYPEAAFRTLAKHARLDLRHRADLNELVDRLPLTPVLEDLIGLSALRTVDLNARLIEELLA